MRLYLDCGMGASGDMMMAALYELLPDKEAFRVKMKRLELDGVTLVYSASTKCGITGMHITVQVCGAGEKSEDVNLKTAGTKQEDASITLRTRQKLRPSAPHNHEKQSGDHHHHHGDGARRYGYEEIVDLIHELDLPDNVFGNALEIYRILGEAEAAVHGLPLNKIHFHEIGSLDAVTDIVGCCLLINMLGVSEIIASPVHVGSGSVRCEHGILPVPAPATAEILKGVPIYGGQIEAELCTPTGAALLKHFVTKFREMPPVTVVKTGYGMGTKDFEAANCLRAFLCEDEATCDSIRDTVYEISCNLDDMTPEAIGAPFELLLDHGALDVYTTPIMMKKNRPAVMLSCLCAEDKRDNLARLILEHTTTLGVRITTCNRDVMNRSAGTVRTEYGDIRVKHAHGFGVIKNKPEYDDVLAAAKQHGVPFTTVHKAAIVHGLPKNVDQP